MGVMRFQVHPLSVVGELGPQAQMTGFDGRAFPMRIEVSGSELSCSRNHSDSGRLHMLCPVEGIGSVVLSTASLRERTDAYSLPLELCRGTLVDLRNQAGAWDVAGLRVPEEFDPVYRKAMKLFAKSTFSQSNFQESCELAWDAIHYAVRAGRILTEAYISQRLIFRKARTPSLPVSLGCDIGPQVLPEDEATRFASTFNSALVPIQWRDVEPTEGEYKWDALDGLVDWCSQNRLFVIAGPLLDLSEGGLPKWLETWQHDFLNLQSFVSDFVETAVSRYAGRVRHWEIVANPNTGRSLNLLEENCLSLAARALEVARQVDEEIQLSLMIDQPFGEYMSRGEHRLSPLQFVDALARSGVGLSEAHLQIQIGEDATAHSLPRHVLQFSRIMDQWSYLGLPLSVSLSFAKQSQDEEVQAALLKRYVPLLMAKDSVVGIYWGCHRDGTGSRFDGCGLLRNDGSERETFRLMQGYREQFWRTDS